MADNAETTRFERGMEIFKGLNPEGAAALSGALGDIAPDMMRYVAEFPFGDLYARDNSALDPKLRQAATLAALACGGHIAQLKIHLTIALNMGFSREELVEVFMQLAPYGGFPVAINAILALKEVAENK